MLQVAALIEAWLSAFLAKAPPPRTAIILTSKRLCSFATASLWTNQPPLYFYLLLMREREWEQIHIVTNGHEWKNVNPVVPALLAKKASGELPSNVNIHTVGPRVYVYSRRKLVDLLVRSEARRISSQVRFIPTGVVEHERIADRAKADCLYARLECEDHHLGSIDTLIIRTTCVPDLDT